MVVPYHNITELQHGTTVSGLFTYANEVSQGILGGLFIMVVFFVILIILKNYDFLDSITAASWICALLSLFAKFAGIVGLTPLITFGTIMVICLGLQYLKKF